MVPTVGSVKTAVALAMPARALVILKVPRPSGKLGNGLGRDVADQLGSAVLTLSVDDKQLQAGLARAQQTSAAAGQQIGNAFSTSAPKTLTSLTIKLNSLQQELQGVAIGTKRFTELRNEIQRTEAVIAAAGGKGGGGVGLLAGSLGALAGPLATAAAVSVAVAGIGYAATQTAGNIQKLNAAFTGLTGSAEAAKQLRQDLFTLSKTTPFRNEEILQAAQRFLAVGVNVKNLQGTINRVGAIAAQSGQSLNRLALIYAQVYAKGRLQGEENLQLLEAGVDLTQELAQVTGLSGAALQDAMSKGQISVEKFNAALKLATGDMSALQLAGQAVDVQFNNIFDNFGQLFGGFASSIAPALSTAFGVINQIFDQAFPSLASIEELFAPLTAEAKRFSEVLAGNPQLISAIAAAVREWAGLVVNDLANGLQFVNNILSKLDGSKLTKSLIESELVIRRIYLAAQSVGQVLIKNAELSLRALNNPIQFGKDIAGAGGFGKFLAEEYADARNIWNRLITSKPLTFDNFQATSQGALAGGLDNKLVKGSEVAKQNLIDAYDAAARSAERIAESAAKAKVDFLELQASPDKGLNRFLTGDQVAIRRQESVRELAPYVQNAIRDASGILSRQNISLPQELIAQLQRTTSVTQRRAVGEINGRTLFAGPETVSQPQLQTQLDFIRAVQEEKASITSVRDSQIELATSLKELAQKDWTVQVQVNSDGSSASYGDVLNQAVTQ